MKLRSFPGKNPEDIRYDIISMTRAQTNILVKALSKHEDGKGMAIVLEAALSSQEA